MANMVLISRRSQLPIINGFVYVPDIGDLTNKRLTLADALAAIPGSTVEINPLITDIEQSWFVLPEFDREIQFPADYFQILRDAAS